MGTGASASPRDAGRRSPGSISPLRDVGCDEPAAPFASPPPIVWPSDESFVSPKSSSAQQTCSRSSPTTANTWSDDADLERGERPSMATMTDGGKSDVESHRGKPSKMFPKRLPASPHVVVIDDGGMMAGAGQNEAALSGESSKMSLRSAAASAHHSRPSFAKGSSQARPKWTRPKPTAASTSQVGGLAPSSSDSLGVNADDAASLHPQSLASRFEDDRGGASLNPAERLTKLPLQEPDYLAFIVKDGDGSEPPPTPSTISGQSFNCTQSSWSGSSGWGSRPTTRSSGWSSSTNGWGSRPSSSSNFQGSSDHVAPEDERFHVLYDCTRESRIRASGTQSPNGANLHNLSVKTAWGPEMLEEA